MINCEQAYDNEIAKFDRLIELLIKVLENQKTLLQDLKDLNAIIGVKSSGVDK